MHSVYRIKFASPKGIPCFVFKLVASVFDLPKPARALNTNCTPPVEHITIILLAQTGIFVQLVLALKYPEIRDEARDSASSFVGQEYRVISHINPLNNTTPMSISITPRRRGDHIEGLYFHNPLSNHALVPPGPGRRP